MGNVREDNYVVIQGWMLSELGLKGNELMIYAIIYGYSQDGQNRFTGGLQYLADWTNSTKQSVIKCIKSLVDKGFIGKEEKYINGVKFCEYYSTKFNGVLNKVEWGIKQSLTGGIKQSLPNNIINNNKNNNKENNKENNKRKVFFPNDEKLDDAFRDYVDFRKKIRKPMTERAIELAINKLQDLGNNDNEVMIAILNQSIMQGWQGLFPLKNDNVKKNYTRPQKAQEMEDSYYMMAAWAQGE